MRRSEIQKPGMLQQETVTLAQQTYQSQHELYAQCPTYCGQDVESKNRFKKIK